MRWPGKTVTIEMLVDGHYSSLYRYAFRLSGKAQEAEDLTQEAFCQAQAKWGQLRDLQLVPGKQAAGDQARIADEKQIAIESVKDSELILLDLPE